MIVCENVSISYGRNTIINNFNYTFKDGKITTIIGESGRGKTTLIRAIAGLTKYSGKILYIDENNIEHLITKPNKDICMMHQHYSNFPWKTCRNNILFPLSLERKLDKKDYELADKILDEIGLLNHANKYPMELSGGMNQRLALGRILIQEPKVLLMDEPMSALDPETRKKMQKLIIDLNKKTNTTIIMITHDMDEAKLLGDFIIQL